MKRSEVSAYAQVDVAIVPEVAEQRVVSGVDERPALRGNTPAIIQPPFEFSDENGCTVVEIHGGARLAAAEGVPREAVRVTVPGAYSSVSIAS